MSGSERSRAEGADVFGALETMPPLAIWDGIVARAVHGERISFGVVELEPNGVVPEHAHENEQLGMVIAGSVSFRVEGEERELGPGGTWRIGANRAHEVHAGPEGAVVIDVFAPPRDDWRSTATAAPRPPRWP